MKRKKMTLKRAIESLEFEMYEEGHLSYVEEELEMVLDAAKKYQEILQGQQSSLEIVSEA